MYTDRNLVKQPSVIRMSQPLKDYIQASANMAGVSFSEMVRMMLHDNVEARIEQMTHSKAKDSRAERI